jgi:tetratricopeptide (TPR) repeat protein
MRLYKKRLIQGRYPQHCRQETDLKDEDFFPKGEFGGQCHSCWHHMEQHWSYLLSEGKYDLAMDSYRKALRIRPLEQGDSVDVAATIFNIGQVNHHQGDSDRVLPHNQEFLKLAKKHFGEDYRNMCNVTTIHALDRYCTERRNSRRLSKPFTTPSRSDVLPWVLSTRRLLLLSTSSAILTTRRVISNRL